MSRWVISLVVIQIVLILALLVKTIELENQVAALHSEAVRGASSAVAGSQPLLETEDDEWAGERLDERQLRRIVAEEMRAVVNGMPVAESLHQSEPEKSQVSSAEYELRLDKVVDQLGYHIDRGEISPGEMAQLQSDIAHLDEESRTYVLGLLVRAISSGELDGEL